MSDTKTFGVPLAKADNHPVMIAVGPNPAMGRWDIQILIGNYASKADAEEDAKAVKRALERAIKADFGAGRVQ
jgi:hypothetical protein